MKKFKTKKKPVVDFEFVGPVVSEGNTTDTNTSSSYQDIDQIYEEEAKITNEKSGETFSHCKIYESKSKKDDEKVAKMIEKRYADYVLTLEGFLDEEDENVSDEEETEQRLDTPKFMNLASTESDRDNVYNDIDNGK